MNLKKQLRADHIHAGSQKKQAEFKANVDPESEGCTILIGANSNLKEIVSCFIRLKVRTKTSMSRS